MPSQDLIIFGDSYADPNWPQDWTWTKTIKSHFDNVENYAFKGTGPDWSLNQFYHQDKKIPFDKKSQTNILFLLSAETRFNFSFYNNPAHQSIGVTKTRNEVQKEVIQENGYAKFQKFYKQFMRYYVYGSSFKNTEVFKIISYLYMHANMYNKVLVVPVFFKFSNYELQKIPSNKKFHVVTTPLYDLQLSKPMGKDKLPNHWIEHNHYEFSKTITDWFINETPINYSNFQKLLDK